MCPWSAFVLCCAWTGSAGSSFALLLLRQGVRRFLLALVRQVPRQLFPFALASFSFSVKRKARIVGIPHILRCSFGVGGGATQLFHVVQDIVPGQNPVGPEVARHCEHH